MERLNKLRYQGILQVLFWVIWIGSKMTYFDSKSTYGMVVDIYLAPTVLGHIAMFYINAYVLVPVLFVKRRYMLFGFFVILTVFIISWTTGYFTNQIYPILPSEDFYPDLAQYLQERLVSNTKRSILSNSIITGISFAYAYTSIWIRNEKVKAALAEENLKSELAYLNAQIDPHFLFNTLNTIYSLALKGKKMQTETGLEKLIGFIDQLTGEENNRNTTLKKEVIQIENYIDLQKLRFSSSDDITVEFKNSVDSSDYQITPRVLMPLVENAFKHGISLENPSFIRIDLLERDGKFQFSVLNSNHSKTNTSKSTLIGLENIRKRLELIYSGRFNLGIEDHKSNTYKVSLTIDNQPS